MPYVSVISGLNVCVLCSTHTAAVFLLRFSFFSLPEPNPPASELFVQAACLNLFSFNEGEGDDGASSSLSDAPSGQKEVMTLEEICAALQLEESFAKKVLHSLSCGKYKVLAKAKTKSDPKGRKIQTGDQFSANAKFSCNSRKIRIPMASLQASHNPKRVEEDRTVAIEAAIVRIMKARKTMQHNQLVAEVLNQLQFFRPQPKSVKRRIEHLIDREYLERDENQSNMYRYLA